MKLKKFFSQICEIVFFSAVLFAAPKQEGNLKKIKPKQPVVLNVYVPDSDFSGVQTGWFADLLLGKFNVKLNISNENQDAVDFILWNNNSEAYENACKNGELLNLESKLDGKNSLISVYGPYILANMKQALQKNKYIDSPDKKLHGFGQNISTSSKTVQAFTYTWNLRFDLYEEIGKPKLKELNDLISVLEKMKEQTPADDNGNPTLGLSLTDDLDKNMVQPVSDLISAYYGYDEFDFGFYSIEDGKFYDCLSSDSPYMIILTFLNQLHQKGLLNSDASTKSLEEVQSDYINGKAFWNVNNSIASSNAMYPVCPKEAHPLVYGNSVFGDNQFWTISSKTEYPELCMAILNWFATPEGYMTIKYGPKDVCWKVKAGKLSFTEAGRRMIVEQSEEKMPSPFNGTFQDGCFKIKNSIWCENGDNPLSYGETYNYLSWKSEPVASSAAIESAWREWSKSTSPYNYMKKKNYVVCPGSLYKVQNFSEELAAKQIALADLIKAESWNAIYAASSEEFGAITQKMISDAKALGYDDFTTFSRKSAEKRFAVEKLSFTKN